LRARDFKVSTELVVKRKLRACADVCIIGSKEVGRRLARREIASSRSGSLGGSSVGLVAIDGEGNGRCKKCNSGERKQSNKSLQFGIVLGFRFGGRRTHVILIAGYLVWFGIVWREEIFSLIIAMTLSFMTLVLRLYFRCCIVVNTIKNDDFDLEGGKTHA